MKCPDCGFEDTGNFCSNCGASLQLPEKTQETNLPQNWTDMCPVCKSGPLQFQNRKALMGLSSKSGYNCPQCGAFFAEKSGRYQLAEVSDQSNDVWVQYKKEVLGSDEWQRIAAGGLSDAKQRKNDIVQYYTELRAGNVEIGTIGNSPIILKKKEEHLFTIPNMTLKEPRSVRKSSGSYGGPRIRVAKGVSFGVGAFGATSESHEEIRNIDVGDLTITSKRIVYAGSKKTSNIPLSKIISMNPYSDGIGINRENKQKMEYFVGLPKMNIPVQINGREYQEPFNGQMLMYIIEGLISRME